MLSLMMNVVWCSKFLVLLKLYNLSMPIATQLYIKLIQIANFKIIHSKNMCILSPDRRDYLLQEDLNHYGIYTLAKAEPIHWIA